jgi:hypothetical protein
VIRPWLNLFLEECERVKSCPSFISEIKDVDREINKTFRPIWEFTYRILGADETRVRLVNRDPDNLLVSWIPGLVTEGLA